NPPKPFSRPIQTLLTPSNHSPPPTPAETAANLVNSVTISSDPAHALWELWDAFSTAVATSPTSHNPHLSLHAHPPTQPNERARSNASSYIEADGKLYCAQWRDVHDILEAWRNWDGVRDSSAGNSTISTLSSSGGEYFLRFCVFSAALLNMTKGKGNVPPIWVFFACRDVLERDGPQSCPQKGHRMSSEQLWALDV
ncbi:hypothetical protein N7537_007655, partial [Penicillium hordei]